MKILIVSDIHGRSLAELEPEIKKIEPSKVLVLGDFDTVHTIHEVIDLEKKYHAEVFPGNHEDALYKGYPIKSGNMEKLGKDFNQLYRELANDKQAHDYVEKLLDNYYKKFNVKSYGNNYNVLALHGALTSYTGNSGINTKDAVTRELWNRLETRTDHIWNFRRMKEQGINVHLRGHDGRPEIAYGVEGGISIKVKRVHPQTEDPVKFMHGAMHTITTGDYADGHYAILDTKPKGETEPVVYFKKI